ncbi:phosphatase [Pseudomonas parafulva]|uniref:phosphatase n=1 Tax=Pseudomonas parafulva TaxID=157782 RepID=UPI000A7B4B21|nr:phosphatase [Pseudomonas parafulva]
MLTVRGDLVALFQAGAFDVIVHGQNCHCNMDDGIARAISQAFPEALQADMQTPIHDPGKLGTYSKAVVTQGVIINGYTQFNWSGVGPGGGPLTQYEAVRAVFAGLRAEFGGQGLCFGVPAIGAARGGGDWSIISAIIDEELAGEHVTFVEYDQYDGPSGDYRRNMAMNSRKAMWGKQISMRR